MWVWVFDDDGCTGRAGEECAKADGRELWVLGQLYRVHDLLEWLLETGITKSNFGAPYVFGLVLSGDDRERILAKSLVALEQNGSRSLAGAGMQGVRKMAAEALKTSLALVQPGAENGTVDESLLLGFDRKAVEALVRHFDMKGVGQRLGWRYVRYALRILFGWMTANIGPKTALDGPVISWFQEVVNGLDLMKMPLRELSELLEGCEYVDRAWASDLVQRKQEPVDCVYKMKYKESCRYELGDDFVNSGTVNFAFDGKGGPERRVLEVDGVKRVVMRMALVDANKEVVMVNIKSGERFVSFGSLGVTTGQKIRPGGVAFGSTGELYVSDCASDQVLVFDRQGRFSRRLGEAGVGEGQFKRPCGICLTADGNLVVADSGNHRVQVFGKDGKFVRAFGSETNGAFYRHCDTLCPTSVCQTPDGSFAVFDNKRCCVVVFDVNGGIVRTFWPRGRKSGSNRDCCSLAVGGGGEIIICDGQRRYVQVYHRCGELLQVIGPGGDSKVQWEDGPTGVCTDAEGRLFIVDGNSVVVLSG